MNKHYKFYMKIAGKEQDIESTIRGLKDLKDLTFVLKGTEEINCHETVPDTKIICSDLNGESSRTLKDMVKALAEQSRKYGTVLEAYGVDEKEHAQEHILIDRGEIMAATKAPFKDYHLPSLSEQELDDLLFEEGCEKEDLQDQTDENGVFHTGGLELFGDFLDLAKFLEQKSIPFLEHTDCFGDTVYVTPRISAYRENNNLYLGLGSFIEEYHSMDHYTDITVNVGALPYLYSAIDTSFGGEQIMAFLEKHGIAKNTGHAIPSGFCFFPVYRFHEEKLMELDPENFREYAKLHGRELPAKESLSEKIHRAEQNAEKKKQAGRERQAELS